MTPYMGEVVNFVNASIIARDRGITVRESKSSSSEDFASMVTITAMGGEERNVVAGALFGTKDFRIVQINDFLIEAVPRGNMLLIHNYDRPGVIGNIGTALGNRNINIATMQFSRERMGGQRHFPASFGFSHIERGDGGVIAIAQYHLRETC